MNAAWHCVLELQVAKALAGRTAGISDLTDGEFDEARDLASMLDTDIHEESGWYCATKVRLHYLAGEIDDALAWATRALGFLHAVGGQYTESELAVFRALALLARATEPAAGDASAARLAEARGIVDGVRAWHAVGPRSFAHRLALIEGELARAEGRADDALRHFAAAAGRASDLGQLQYAGIAHERRAALLCDLGDAGAREAAGAARAAFAHWGAAALAARIDRRYGAQALHLP
jgi:tetratricopeptide (TPR) repeat protein